MSGNVVFESDRKFVLSSYGLSHGLLLFRSNRENSHPTRIDLLFQYVHAMDLRTYGEGLKIELIGKDWLQKFPTSPADLVEHGLVAFRIGSKGWEGYVVASPTVGIKEDNLGPTDPSGLFQT